MVLTTQTIQTISKPQKRSFVLYLLLCLLLSFYAKSFAEETFVYIYK